MEEIIDLASLYKYFWNKRKTILYIILGFVLIANLIFFAFGGFEYSNIGKVKISSEANNNRVISYNDLISSDKIIDKAINISGVRGNKEYIKKNISITANNGSNIYSISLNYNNKEDGKALCTAIINGFIGDLEWYDGSFAMIYDNVVTTGPINFNGVKTELRYAFVGCMLSLCYVFVLFYYDKKIKNDSELYNHNILGKIDVSKSNLALIKTKIKLNNLGNIIFLNTPKEIDCKNDVFDLVNEFAKDSKVIFVDTNIRSKSKKSGYSDLLSNYKENISNYISNNGKFDTIESGTINKEVEVLLSNKNNEKLLKELKKKYDYVILYNSNTALYSDSLILSKLCDCNYLIVGINQTDKRDFSKSIESYKQINSDVNGIIIIDKE